MIQRWWLAPLLCLLACGPRPAGTQANQTYFWRVQSSTLEFGTCSDDPGFRMGLAPLKFESNSYLIYKVDKTNQTATTQTCDRLAVMCRGQLSEAWPITDWTPEQVLATAIGG